MTEVLIMFANPSSHSRARNGSKMSELPEHPKMQDIRTSKNCPLLTCFVHFDLIMHFSPQRRVIFRHQNFKKCSENGSFFNIFHFQMCFSPQRRAILRHQNFKKQSENDVFCTFSLQNALLATAACNFAKSELQKAVRT